MADPKQSLAPHGVYPALPVQATAIQPDTGCAACPLAQSDGHKSCSTFRLENDPATTAANRIDLKRLRELQGRLHRRAFDSDGIIGSHNGSSFDFWYYYNSKDAINFVYFSSWNLVGISGNQVTVEVKNPVDPDADAKTVLEASWRTVDAFGRYINGYQSYTSVSPLDMLEFQYPSKAYQLQAKIVRVISASDTQLVLELDKDLSAVAASYFEVLDGQGDPLPDPTYPDVKIYLYGRSGEKWRYIQEPYYFLGRRTIKTINVADVPGDGIWTLEEGVISPPPATEIDPLSPTFLMEGFKDGVGWETISENVQRLHIKPTLACYALKTTLPAGSARTSAPGSDLTETYIRFRCTYYVNTTADDPNCRIVGYDRCFHSRIDYSGSAYTAATGVGTDAGGRMVFCSERVYEKYEEIDEINRFAVPPVPGQDGYPERVEVTKHHPSGLADFPTLGNCIQYNYCDKFVNSIDKMGDAEAPFNIDYTLAFLIDLIFACDKRLHQRQLYAFGAGGLEAQRIAHPSIAWLLGYYAGIVSGDHYFGTRNYPRGHGEWSVDKPKTVVDQSGNESLQIVTGFERGYLYEPTATPEVDQDRRGVLPSVVPGYTTKRDPFDPALTVADDLLEYIGAMVQRDDMTITDSRGVSRISMALGAENILAPNFDLSLNTLQQHTRATFIKPSYAADGVVHILPYRQEGKAERSLGTRQIDFATSLGGHKWQIDFENETRTYSVFDVGSDEIGDSYNRILTVQGGGVPPILPYENQGLSSYEGDNETGSRASGLQPLDVIDINGNRFVVESVTPHGGLPALTWGNRKDVYKGGIGGYFEATVDNGDDGEPLTPIEIVHVRRFSDSLDFTVNTDSDKPALISTQVWFDGNNFIYFAAADDAVYMEIKYKDRGKPNEAPTEYTKYFTIDGGFEVTTEIDYADFTGATNPAVFAGATGLIITTNGTNPYPTPGEVYLESYDVGGVGKIKMLFNIDDAPSDWKIVLPFDEAAAPPTDTWAVGNAYLSFGKNKDVIVVRADAYDGGGDWFTENSAAGETAEFFQSAAVFLPRLDAAQVVEWTVYESDNWQAVPAANVTVNAAAGRVTIDAAWFASEFDPGGSGALVGSVCFRMPGIQMVDNRGQFPASLMNKLEAMIEAMGWVLTSMGGGMGEYDFGISQSNYHEYKTTDFENDPCASDHVFTSDVPLPSSARNKLKYGYVGSTSLAVCSAELGISASAFGLPTVLENLPDGCEIIEALAEISGGGLTRTYVKGGTQYTKCDGSLTPEVTPINDTDPDPSDIDLTVIGFTSETAWEVVGSAPGVGNGTKVVNVTNLINTMWQERRKYVFGYAVFFSPTGLSPTGDGIGAFIPGEPPSHQLDYCEGDPCYGSAHSSYRWFYQNESWEIDWSNCSFGRVALKIDYKGTDKLGVQPRFPSMVDLP